ncbi:hypothetical protein BC629DRAFT_1594313 [Irpex lacteus]|nr:hypothetical protein BC629DRAFT_1594313 [Irpex lacteus]
MHPDNLHNNSHDGNQSVPEDMPLGRFNSTSSANPDVGSAENSERIWQSLSPQQQRECYELAVQEGLYDDIHCQPFATHILEDVKDSASIIYFNTDKTVGVPLTAPQTVIEPDGIVPFLDNRAKVSYKFDGQTHCVQRNMRYKTVKTPEGEETKEYYQTRLGIVKQVAKIVEEKSKDGCFHINGRDIPFEDLSLMQLRRRGWCNGNVTATWVPILAYVDRTQA